MIKTPN